MLGSVIYFWEEIKEVIETDYVKHGPKPKAAHSKLKTLYACPYKERKKKEKKKRNSVSQVIVNTVFTNRLWIINTLGVIKGWTLLWGTHFFIWWLRWQIVISAKLFLYRTITNVTFIVYQITNHNLLSH